MPGGMTVSASGTTQFGQAKIDKEGHFKLTQKVDGLDMLAEFEAMADAQRLRAKPYEDQIDTDKTKVLPELAALEAKTSALQKAVSGLTNFIGYDTSSVPNAFQSKEASILPGADNSVFLTVTQSAVASSVPMTFAVQQMAKNDSVSTTLSKNFSPTVSMTTDPTIALALTGDLVINGQTVTINPAMTLDDINTAVGVIAGAANITVGINGSGDSSYLVLTSSVANPVIDLTGTDPAISTGLALTTDQVDPTIALGMSGDLVMNGETVTVTTTMSLTDIRNAINAVGAVASVTTQLLNLSSTDGYKLTITSTETAVPIDFTGTSASLQGSNGLGLPSSNTTLDSLVAKFTYNGDNVVRTTNQVADLITGVTINLQSESTPPGATSAIIGIDANNIYSTIVTFVKSYNDVVEQIDKNQKATMKGGNGEVEVDSEAVLYGKKILRDLKDMMTSFAGQAPSGLSSGNPYKALPDIGIKFVENNPDEADRNISGKLYLDTDTLKSVLNTQTNIPYVAEFLGNSATVTSSYFSVGYFPVNLNPLVAGQPITVTYINNGDATFSATLSVPGQAVVTIDPLPNVKIINGPAGSIFEGLTIGYSSEAPVPSFGDPETTIITLTQGIADNFNNSLKSALQKAANGGPPVGMFESAVDLIKKKDEQLTGQVKRINDAADRFLARLEAKIGQVYQAADKAKSIVSIIDAFNNMGRD